MADSTNQALAQLKDIHLPADVSWWPLAPGWYVLLVLMIVLVFFSAVFYWHWRNQRLSKKQALKILSAYQEQYQNGQNPQLVCAQISELLKRVALVYFPRHQVASLTGDAWVAFLDETGKKTPFKKARYELAELPFEKEKNIVKKNLLIDELFEWSSKWIQQRRKPCLN